MNTSASDIAAALARNAEAVCRHYLSNGRKEGRYWLVGNVHNAPGRSLFVRLAASADGGGAAGKWSDAASGEHGDLLDIIAAARSSASLAETLEEARRFLSIPASASAEIASGRNARGDGGARRLCDTPQAARRLWARTLPVPMTQAAHYLASRGIDNLAGCDALRFHPACFYRPTDDDRAGLPRSFPALLAAVTDLAGSLTGISRCWLAPDGSGKAPVAVPRRAMGHLLGHGVRFGRGGEVMIAGEGVETVLSLRQIMPGLPMMAALSAAHLSAILLPPGIRRLYVARDKDPAGAGAVVTLIRRGLSAGVEVIPLEPMLGDFNDDLTRRGRCAMGRLLRAQLMTRDASDFLEPL